MKDLARLVRKVEQCLGLIITIVEDREEPAVLETRDHELGGRLFSVLLGAPSRWERDVKRFHESIYHARGRERYKQQNAKCALCGRKMSGFDNTEIDHKVTRGAHGRDDRMANLQVVHRYPCHEAKHSKSPKGRVACQR